MNIQRYSRLRSLVHNVNRQRKIQARKIDILCNDMIKAHRGLLARLEDLVFIDRIHQSLIGRTEIPDIVEAINRVVADRFSDCRLAAILLHGEQPRLFPEEAVLSGENAASLAQFFTAENVKAVCAENRAHNLEELLALPLQVPPKVLERCSAVAVPLTADCNAVGVLLLQGAAGQAIASRLVHSICVAAPAIVRALAAAQRPAPLF